MWNPLVQHGSTGTPQDHWRILDPHYRRDPKRRSRNLGSPVRQTGRTRRSTPEGRTDLTPGLDPTVEPMLSSTPGTPAQPGRQRPTPVKTAQLRQTLRSSEASAHPRSTATAQHGDARRAATHPTAASPSPQSRPHWTPARRHQTSATGGLSSRPGNTDVRRTAAASRRGSVATHHRPPRHTKSRPRTTIRAGSSRNQHRLSATANGRTGAASTTPAVRSSTAAAEPERSASSF